MSNIKNKELFGSKVSFKSPDVHMDIKGKYFCLLGYCNSAVALIEWDERGEYNFQYFTATIDELEFHESRKWSME